MTEHSPASYLALLSRRLDDQQLTVCCSHGNVLVAAGAGSGKTHVLATRFAWLVMSENVSADSILTLTFTDKAAAEMYERIYNTLSFFAGNEKTPEPERSRAAKAVADFSNAHIQTLDSYCASIVRSAANRYGIRPDFTIGSAGAERAIRNLALPFVISHRNDPAVQDTAEAGKIQELADQLFADTVMQHTSLADSASFFSDSLSVQKEETARAWNKAVSDLSDSVQLAADMFDALPAEKKVSEYGTLLSRAMEELSGAPHEIVTPESIGDGSAAAVCAQCIRAVRLFYFNQNTKGYTNPLRNAVGGIKKDGGPGPVLESVADYIIRYKTIRRMYELLDQFLAVVNESKRRTGELTFTDVTELALLILREQPDIRRQEAESYQRIMIDEFQDNNGKNRQLLEYLSQTDLFYVGDEKQSVYKFRGADVSVFASLKNDIQNAGGSVYSMVYNYRSTPQLLSSFNQIFGGLVDGKKMAALSGEEESSPYRWIFPEKPLHAYEAGFSVETAARRYDPELGTAEAPAGLTGSTVPVHVCMLNTSGILSDDSVSELYLRAKDQLAYFIAEKINELAASGVRYSDIAILDRSRTDRSSLISYLSRASVPYTVDQHKDLFAEAPVNDIYTILRLCVYPSDINAFAAFLCSPFAGLDEQSVETVLARSAATERDAVFQPFPEEERDGILRSLSAEERIKYEAAEKTYADMSEYVPSHRITETVSRLWYQYGYQYEFLWDKTVSLFAEQYDLLFELARLADGEGKSPAWFVDQLAQKKKYGGYFASDDSDIHTEEVTYPVERRDCVQIMTIHKSKGLQFKYVFLYGCTGKPKPDSNRERVFWSESCGVSLNFRNGSGNYFYQRQKEETDRKDDAEFRRLFYVGLTRAEKEAYIVGSWSRPKTADSRAPMFEAVIENYYDGDCSCYAPGAPFDFTVIEPAEKKVLYEMKRTGRRISAEDKLHCAESLAAGYEKAMTLVLENVPLNRITPSSLEAAFIPGGSGSMAGDRYTGVTALIENGNFKYADFGTLVHAYLEAFAHGTAPETFVPSPLLFAGVEKAKDRSVIKESCIQMVQGFARSGPGMAFREAQLHGRWNRSEYAFRSFSGGIFVSGSIDLAYENGDGTYTVVDYKTDKVQRPELYVEQQAVYRRAVSEIKHVPLGKINCVLYYLRTDSVCSITEALNKLSSATSV